MKLLDSLLDAIVRLEGDALVMHVGEKPYVITASASMNAYRGPLAWGQVELSSRVLTFDAVSSMLTEILPADQQRALDEFGAIEHEILPPNGILDRFTVVAARGGEDVWVEVRRKPLPVAIPDTSELASVAAHVAPGPAAMAAPAAAPAEAAPVASAPPEEPRAPEAPAASAAPQAGAPEEPVAIDTIVVALPGEGSEEVTLDGVPDNAIQIVDDEPQDVPTEAEVDAMLAATASALLTSGLGADPVEESDIVAAADTVALIDAQLDAESEIAHQDHGEEADLAGEVELVFDQDAAVSAPVAIQEIDSANSGMHADADAPGAEVAQDLPAPGAAIEPQPEGPPFELVAPTEHVAEPVVDNEPEAAVDVPPQGTPLFSDAAVAAAAPVEPAIEIEVETPAQPDLAAHVSVWSDALTVWNTAVPSHSPDLSVVEPPVATPVQPVAGRQQEITHPEPAVRSDVPSEAQDVAALPELSELPQLAEIPELPEFAEHLEIPEIDEDVRAVSDEISPEPSAVERVNAAIEAAPPVETPTLAEMRMETTPESRPDAAGALGRAAYVAPGTHEPVVHAHADEDARPGVVVPLSRSPIKAEPPLAPFRPSDDAALMHTLRVAAARGAATVYVVAQSKPMIRVDGEIIPLESEPTLTAADVDRLVMELAPPRRRDALQNGPVEWLCDVPEIGRVRCLTFRDHRGPGVLFRMFPPRAISADQLGLTPEVQALCQQPDGLVLVTGARASGKSTLLNAFIDLINRTRSDHVITVESQIGFVHESRKSFISQRETRGDADLAASVARAALREDPDVMMIEELKSADLAAAALEAAESGRLVLASMPAVSTIGAIERLLELFPADRRAKVRASLATALRGVIAQVLLRRVTGGRVAAREILLNTPAVSTLVLEGKMFQLPVALDSGRRHGMVPLTDSLAACVREGVVHPAEAYRKALDRAALVAVLKRDGVDTSFAERLA